MDFQIPDDLRDLQERTRRFIAGEILQLEGEVPREAHGPSGQLRRELVFRARAAVPDYDGPGEMHRWSMARKLVRQHGAQA